MNRIERVFTKLQKENGKALIPYVSCGDPSLEFTEQLVVELADNGADLIELGVPYSDPVADGPTIQKASVRALAGGVTLEKIFLMVGRLREKTNIPLIMMTYYNPVYVTGIEKFMQKAREVGIDGLIIPDIPFEEAGYLQEIAQLNGIHLILLVAPTSTPERIKKIGQLSRGFIYCVSVTGVTGARKQVFDQLGNFLAKVRLETKLPLAVGFGISGPETVRQVAKQADGVIVGSALIEIIEQNIESGGEYGKALKEAVTFIKKLKAAIQKINF